MGWKVLSVTLGYNSMLLKCQEGLNVLLYLSLGGT